MKKLFNKWRILYYAGIGVIWILLWTLTSLINYPETFLLHTVNEVWRAMYIVFANFIFFEYSVPYIRKKRHTAIYNSLAGILLIALQLVLISLGLYCWIALGSRIHVYTSLRQIILAPDTAIHRFIDEVIFQAKAGVISIIFFGVAKLFNDNFKLKQLAQQLRLERQEAELNFLKSQTNPHFLFNTLNNIYSLARKKSDMTAESILRLSKILRFMLYEANQEYISIAQELEVLDDYIALEKLRYTDSLVVNFKQNIEDPGQLLPPLLMIPLVENAFKHGVSESRTERLIEIALTVKKQQFMFVIKNSSENSNGDDIKENIGLSNVRRQLQLLYTDYDLTVKRDEFIFTATLKINLLSNA